MTSQYITYRQSTIHYRKIGAGPLITVCFHGFGEFAATFDLIAAHLHDEHTLLAIDLPHHGETLWKEGNVFLPQDLINLIDCIPEIQLGRFGLMGYSMGGRIALALFQNSPQRITQLILLAPDGFKVNPWYWLATQTLPGNQLFQFTMNHPQWFVGLLRLLRRSGFSNESISKFVNKYLDDRSMREKVYLVWTTMRKFRPQLKNIQALVRQWNIPVRILYGKYDRIIRFENGLKFSTALKNNCEVLILESGHQLLHPRNAERIAATLHGKLSYTST